MYVTLKFDKQKLQSVELKKFKRRLKNRKLKHP